MKKLKLFALAILIATLNSCEKGAGELPENLSANGDTIGTFLDEKVNLPQGITQSDLDFYLTNVALDSNQSSTGMRLGYQKKEFLAIPWDVIVSFAEKAMANYPDLSSEKFSESDLQKIQKDFSAARTLEDAQSIKEKLFEYYNFRVGKDVEVMCADYLNKGGNLKISTPYTTTALEHEVALLHPIAALNVNGARKDVEDMLVELIGTDQEGDGNANNAFRHAGWNALIVKKCCYTTANKWKSLTYAQMFTSAHEMTGPNYGLPPVDSVALRNHAIMDLFNNLSGRTYMYNTVGTSWIGNPTNIPSHETIKNTIYAYSRAYKPSESLIKSYVASPPYNDTELGHYKDGLRDDGRTVGKLVHIY